MEDWTWVSLLLRAQKIFSLPFIMEMGENFYSVPHSLAALQKGTLWRRLCINWGALLMSSPDVLWSMNWFPSLVHTSNLKKQGKRDIQSLLFLPALCQFMWKKTISDPKDTKLLLIDKSQTHCYHGGAHPIYEAMHLAND
jgi:hypothetical protein